VHDALGRAVPASYAEFGAARAVIDVASASGIARLAPAELAVFSASSRGTGELALAALQRGARELWLGVGGSASVDGGLGLLRALGVRALDSAGREVPEGARGLAVLASFDFSGLEPRARAAKWKILCDVEAPLLGPHGALAYARQKGASAADLPELERGLERFAELLERATSKDTRQLVGGGAAGGIPASLHALLGAELVSGIDFVLDAGGFDAALLGAELVISAEGRFDAQSLCNKGPVGVARRAQRHGVPCVVLAGSVGDDFDLAESPVSAVLSITQQSCDLEHARGVARDWLARTAEQTLRVFTLGVDVARQRSDAELLKRDAC